ncbi:MAG: hypothetical protein WB622_11845 [Acidobacteriaceae bacterium]
MEVLSNLAWIAVALTLWSMWLTERRRRRGGSLLPGLGVQLSALAVLTFILLPVISLSDDLQASRNPAEVERTCIRNDQHLLRPDAVPPVPAALTVVFSFLLLASPRTIAFLSAPSLPRSEWAAHVRVFTSRPPPIA